MDQQSKNSRSKKSKNNSINNSNETRQLFNQLDSYNSNIKKSFLKKINKLENENANLLANKNETIKKLDALQMKSKKEYMDDNVTSWETEYLKMENRKLRDVLSKLNVDPNKFVAKELTNDGKFVSILTKRHRHNYL